jgi:hypothetical protein
MRYYDSSVIEIVIIYTLYRKVIHMKVVEIDELCIFCNVIEFFLKMSRLWQNRLDTIWTSLRLLQVFSEEKNIQTGWRTQRPHLWICPFI